MFRRLPSSLPKDPQFPADLKELGFMITDADQIRTIKDPEQKYLYLVSKNERVNELFREAMNTCIREIVLSRLHALGLETLRLPLGTAATEPHIPILASKGLAQASRVLVIFGERTQDLGIWAYRVVGEQGIRYGSAIELVEGLAQQQQQTDAPAALVIANPGQLLWYRGGGRAMSHTSWLALPRPETAVDGVFHIDERPGRNVVTGNHDYREHVEFVFEHVLKGLAVGNSASKNDSTAARTTFDIIGMELTGLAAMDYLQENWGEWNERIHGVCLGEPQSDDLDFLGHRVKTYGMKEYSETIIPENWQDMLNWFQSL